MINQQHLSQKKNTRLIGLDDWTITVCENRPITELQAKDENNQLLKSNHCQKWNRPSERRLTGFFYAAMAAEAHGYCSI